jgi:glucose 1-dehydrogenase
VKALTVVPWQSGTTRLEDVEEPEPAQGSVLVESIAVGICGTDREIAGGYYGWAPPGRERLVIGHESLGRVIDPGPNESLAAGDTVVGIVRRPDPVPCHNCAAGEWDMCTNGRYTEHGISQLDGFLSERWRIGPEELVKVEPRLGLIGVLLEPTTIVVKAWEHVIHVASRARWNPQTVVVTGDGPIGLLAALIGVQSGLEVHVLGLQRDGLKPELARLLGAHHHCAAISEAGITPDLVIETTGSGKVVMEAVHAAAAGGVVCLTGLDGSRDELWVPASELAGQAVLKNLVLVGSVNANRRHYHNAVKVLDHADAAWLEQLMNRRIPIDCWPEALERQPGDVKVVIELNGR